MFFDSWAELWRLFLIGTLGYIGLIAILRATGKRTLSKMNAFDLVVTVTYGSTFATLILNPDVSLAEGVAAFALLAILQYAVTWFSVRSDAFQSMVKSEPTMLLYEGKYLRRAMKRARVTKAEILAALRDKGHATDKVHAVILETEGRISVIAEAPKEGPTVLQNVERPGGG